MNLVPHEKLILATIAILVIGGLILSLGHKLIASRSKGFKEQYRLRRLLNTVVISIGGALLVLLWSKLFQHTSTFLGLIGAGLAVALREPLLSIAGRIAIFAGHMYTAGDRIEINKLSGDVIDVGFFYTRMMEIGNWISGDQYSGRIIQFANAQVFGAAVFNYTRNFAYIWDEIKLPLTYQSDVKTARDILQSVADDYSRTFMSGAEAQLQQMQRTFMMSQIELKPSVFLKVTDNWVELTLRYLVEPKKRRAASSFIYTEVFGKINQHPDIQIASTTMNVTVMRPQSPQADSDQRLVA